MTELEETIKRAIKKHLEQKDFVNYYPYEISFEKAKKLFEGEPDYLVTTSLGIVLIMNKKAPSLRYSKGVWAGKNFAKLTFVKSIEDTVLVFKLNEN